MWNELSGHFLASSKLISIRILVSLVATHNCPLHQLNVKNDFLNGAFDDEVYMEQPPNFVAQGKSRKLCKLKMSLYSLKQSPRAWFERFAFVQAFGLSRSQKDQSVFWRQHQGIGYSL